MAETMTENEWRDFVSTGTRTGKAAVVKADGTPHVTPIWFVLDGPDLLFTTYGPGVKGKALRRDPRISISVDDQTPPYSFVSLWGEASLSEDVDEVRRWGTVIGGRYMGADRAEEYGARNGVPGELLCRLRPDRIVSAKNVAD